MAGRFNVEEVGIAVFAEAFPLEKIREILKATGRDIRGTFLPITEHRTQFST